MSEIEFLKQVIRELESIKILGDKTYKADKAHELIHTVTGRVRQKEKEEARENKV